MLADFHPYRTPKQTQPIAFPQLRAMPENVIVSRLDAFQNPQAALHYQSQLPADAAAQAYRQRCPRANQRARAGNFEAYQAAPCVVDLRNGQLALADSEAFHILSRQIDPLFFPIDRDVLPEIDLLQR